jgi:hypothetical protein
VRAVHNRRYGGRQFDREFVMRAEVAVRERTQPELHRAKTMHTSSPYDPLRVADFWNTARHIYETTSARMTNSRSTEAHRFVRAVHNRRYGGRQFDREFVMRAEVVS